MRPKKRNVCVFRRHIIFMIIALSVDLRHRFSLNHNKHRFNIPYRLKLTSIPKANHQNKNVFRRILSPGGCCRGTFLGDLNGVRKLMRRRLYYEEDTLFFCLYTQQQQNKIQRDIYHKYNSFIYTHVNNCNALIVFVCMFS